VVTVPQPHIPQNAATDCIFFVGLVNLLTRANNIYKKKTVWKMCLYYLMTLIKMFLDLQKLCKGLPDQEFTFKSWFIRQVNSVPPKVSTTVTATVEMGPSGPSSEGIGANHEMEKSGSSRGGVDSTRCSITVTEVLPLLSSSVWHIEQMWKLKQYSEVMMLTPKKVILKEVKKRMRNSRTNGRITV